MNTESQTDQDRITQLESACAAMREVMDNALKDPANTGHDTLSALGKVLSSTSAGKALIDRLQVSEKQAKEDKEYIEDLCSQLCKMEDALGFKHDCTDKDGAFVPTIGPWLERVRDLIAAEGELGDTKDRLQAVEKERDRLVKAWELGRGRVHANFGHVPAAIRACDWIEFEMQKALQPAQKDSPQKGTK